jgi:hypothetical protein
MFVNIYINIIQITKDTKKIYLYLKINVLFSQLVRIACEI